MGAMIFGIISAALSAFSSFSQSQQQQTAQQNQARVMEANARVARQNADMQARALEGQARVQEREKSKLRREFNQTMAHNNAALGAGNVDLTSGSAMDVALGNIQDFAIDMGENAYAVALKKWEAKETRRQGNEQANIMEENAKFLKSSSGDIWSSLLTGGLGGFGGFTSGYSQAGGSLGSLFGGNKKAGVTP